MHGRLRIIRLSGAGRNPGAPVFKQAFRSINASAKATFLDSSFRWKDEGDTQAVVLNTFDSLSTKANERPQLRRDCPCWTGARLVTGNPLMYTGQLADNTFRGTSGL